MLLSDFLIERTSPHRAEFAFGGKRKNTKPRSDKGKKRLKRAAMIGSGVLAAAALGVGGVALAKRMKKKTLRLNPAIDVNPSPGAYRMKGDGRGLDGMKQGVQPSAMEADRARLRSEARNRDRESQNRKLRQKSAVAEGKVTKTNNARRKRGLMSLPPGRSS